MTDIKKKIQTKAFTKRKIVRRIVEVFLTFFIVTILSFVLMRLSPVDPATAYATRITVNPTQEQIEQARVKLGMDKPLFVQYGIWVKDAFRLDFGKSLVNGRPVLPEIGEAIPVTMSVTLLCALIIIAGALPLGSLAYLLKGRLPGYLLSLLSIICISIPVFYIANVYLDVFAVKYGVISVAGNTGFMKYFHPALCMAISGIAFYGRLLASGIEREMNEDYVFYARCRGLSEGRILLRHAMPHAMIALIPNFLQMIGLSMAGAAIVERIFSLPGVGYLIIDSVLRRDSPMIHLSILVLAFGLVFFNILSDIFQALLRKENLSEGAVQ